MSKTPKILVIRGGAIGDFILTLPVLAALREQFPAARLEVLGYPHIAQLALVGGVAQNVSSIESRALAGFFARNGELDAALQEYFGGFGLILSFLYDPDEIFRVNISRCSRAQFIQCPHRPDESAGIHATEVFLKPLEKLAIFDVESSPRLAVERAFQTTVHSGRWLAVHPGSGSSAKNWPCAKWTEMLERLAKETTLYFLLIGGEAERDYLKRLADTLPSNRIKLMQNVPLTEVARWIASCQVFVGHDSGISHLAAAVGVPSLILWGKTTEAVWRPKAGVMTLLRDDRGLDFLDVELVIRHIEQLIGKKNTEGFR